MNHKRDGICKSYGSFYESFLNIEKDCIENYKENEISKEIYLQLFKIHYFAGKHSKYFDRGKNHSISDIFQDIIAFYLKTFLGNEYHISLEEKKEDIQPDILIKRNGINHFLIEIKTNIGWERESLKNGKFEDRIEKASNIFEIKKENIIYIFESPGNVSKEFLEIFYDKNKEEAKKIRPQISPYNHIFPLFYSTDPYYMPDLRNINIYDEEIPNEYILSISEKNIISKFEEIIKLIKKT